MICLRNSWSAQPSLNIMILMYINFGMYSLHTHTHTLIHVQYTINSQRCLNKDTCTVKLRTSPSLYMYHTVETRPATKLVQQLTFNYSHFSSFYFIMLVETSLITVTHIAHPSVYEHPFSSPKLSFWTLCWPPRLLSFSPWMVSWHPPIFSHQI